jgi:hypothetical protein
MIFIQLVEKLIMIMSFYNYDIIEYNRMQLRNGKLTSDIERMLENRARAKTKRLLEYNVTASELEHILIADGHQTSRNLRGLKRTFEQSNDQYLKMLRGFARAYGYKYKL